MVLEILPKHGKKQSPETCGGISVQHNINEANVTNVTYYMTVSTGKLHRQFCRVANTQSSAAYTRGEEEVTSTALSEVIKRSESNPNT